MNYTEEQKLEAISEQNRAINELENLNVVDMEKEQRKTLFWFVVLICIGLCCLGFCLVVYGV